MDGPLSRNMPGINSPILQPNRRHPFRKVKSPDSILGALMKLGFISDIHVDINRKNGEDIVLKPLAEETLRQGLDCLVIAGDISSDYKLTLESIDFLSRES